MRRATSADVEQVNQWAGEGEFSGFLSNELNVCLVEGEGCAFFAWRGPGTYELHLALEQRGKAAIETLNRMLDEMRRRGAERFWAAIPVESRHVIIFARLMGWKSRGTAMLHTKCELFVSENDECPQR